MALKQLSKEEHDARTIKLMASINKNNVTAEQVNELFFLHNDIFDPREMGKSCTGCRARVYGRMLRHYNELIKSNDI